MLTTLEGVRRVGPPQAIQKLRENLYLIQVTLSEPPGADWKRLFYDTQQQVSPEFLPRSVDISGAAIRFRADAETVAQRISTIDRWMERANQKEASMGLRSEQQRQRREELNREHQELAELNARLAKI
jgi:hypothetical protein